MVFCHNFTLVSEYAFSQAPSHLETRLAGSEGDSTTGCIMYIGKKKWNLNTFVSPHPVENSAVGVFPLIYSHILYPVPANKPFYLQHLTIYAIPETRAL